MADRLTASLQESILALIALDDKKGHVAAGLLDPKFFDESYREFAERIITHHKQHGKAPGKAHLDDLVDDVLSNPKHKKFQHYTRLIQGVLSVAENLNADYLLTRINDFSRRQVLKAATIEAADFFQQQGNSGTLITDVENVFHKALRFQAESIDAGVFLSDKNRALAFLDILNESYYTGIPALDERGFGPTPKEMLLLIAAKGSGKSWFCVDQARRCLMQGAKVIHISLEMSEPRVIQRYFQNFFAIAKRTETFNVADFKFDREDPKVLDAIKYHERRTEMTLDDASIKKYLRGRISEWGTKFDRLIVKSFPMSFLTIPKLEAYLDSIELTHKFVPHVLIIDYPDLMWTDRRDPRVSLGLTYQELRGLLQRRNIAGIFPTQSNRKGWDAKTIRGSMVAEDATKLMSADMVLILSRTQEEKDRGLARLFVEKSRNDEDQFTILLSQSYRTGQFVLASTRMSLGYDRYREMAGMSEVQEAEEDEYDDD